MLRRPGLTQGFALVLLLATAAPAPAVGKASPVVVQISGRVDATTDVVPHPRCARQLYPLSGTPEDGTGAIYTGTLGGVGGFCTQATMPLVAPDASGFMYHEEHTFVGTVRGCGTGTFRYSLDGALRPFDASKRYFTADEHWTIVTGSGTGGLAGIRSGTNHRAGGVNTDGTVFAVFDPAKNNLTCIPSHQKK